MKINNRSISTCGFQTRQAILMNERLFLQMINLNERCALRIAQACFAPPPVGKPTTFYPPCGDTDVTI